MKELINTNKEWMNLKKRIKELEEEMGKVLDKLDSMDKKLDKLDDFNQTASLPFMELSVEVYRKVEGGSPQAVKLEKIIKEHKQVTDTD